MERTNHTLPGMRLARDFFFFVSMEPDHSFLFCAQDAEDADLFRFLYKKVYMTGRERKSMIFYHTSDHRPLDYGKKE